MCVRFIFIFLKNIQYTCLYTHDKWKLLIQLSKRGDIVAPFPEDSLDCWKAFPASGIFFI